ncbi:DNA cytosine methyltransferase [Epilithonimonas hominis]|uniref:DNA cytosine methyltransferase n=1 Tax=Epilithonimonas hominis TaxID=420404 RepID=UPI002896B6BB|nr:DNA cytosine methyltransferase [Epilithonimonas hominis]
MKNKYIKLGLLAISLLYVDLFCGAGGTSTGVELAKVNNDKCAKVIACVNHDRKAILSHAANHPDTLHFTEDIRTLDLTELIKHVELMRKKYPFAKLVVWASLECTNHSNAKGGMSRDADSRTLAEHLNRYIIALDPDCVQIENVKEFLLWGPLIHKIKNGELQFDKKGKPVMIPNPLLKATDYNRWVDSIKSLGFNYDKKILNAADYGAYTNRKRLFIQFAKENFPIVWPEPSHSKDGKDLPKHNPVRECLDFSSKGKSIFEGKPRSENTLKRLYAGLVKFVANGDKEWIVKFNSVDKNGRHYPPSVDEPCHTVTTQNRLGIAQVEFISKYYSGNEDYMNTSLDSPADVIRTKDCQALVSPIFLSSYYGNGDNTSSLDNPSPTVTTKDRIAKVECVFIDQQYGASKPAAVSEPTGTITANPKFALVSTEFLMNPQYASKGSSIEDPCFTLIARMDKAPPYIIQLENGSIVIEIYETDSPMTVLIKKFMAAFGIADIKMRMLYVVELLKIQGFPVNYILIGNQTDQKKFIGNSVEVNTAQAMCEATAMKLFELKAAA